MVCENMSIMVGRRGLSTRRIETSECEEAGREKM
jgi:hypothetical protein